MSRPITEKLNCSQLEQLCPETYGKIDLYRGIKNLLGNCGKTFVPTRRQPRNSSIEYHSLMNYIFCKIFNYPIRSTTVFCTGSKNTAIGYGDDIYKIYPSAPYIVYWSDVVKDLYALHLSKELLQNSEYTPIIAINCLISKNPEERSVEKIEEYFKEWPHVKDFLTTCYPDFYDCYPDSGALTAYKIFNDFREAIFNSFIKLYKRGNTLDDLHKAALSGNEVMIQCEFYCWQKTLL